MMYDSYILGLYFHTCHFMRFCLMSQTGGDDSGSYISGDNSSDYRKGRSSKLLHFYVVECR